MFLTKNWTYWVHALTQSLAATVFMWFVFMGLDEIATSKIIWAAGASTLASSSFLVFSVPKSPVSKPIKIMGGYVLAMLVGECMRLLANVLCRVAPHYHLAEPHIHMFEFVAGLSVGFTLLLMVIFKVEHPPAAGLAVVMVLDIRHVDAMLVIMAAAVVLTLVRWIFRKLLWNLV